MVDRGGLNYPIRVRDEFSKATAKFRDELRASKKEFRSFQATLRSQKGSLTEVRETAKALQALAASQRQLAVASKRTQKPLTDEEKALRRLADAAKRQQQLERESVRIRSRQTADAQRRATALRREATAREQAARAEQRFAQQQQRATQQAQRAEARQLEANVRRRRQIEQDAIRLRTAQQAEARQQAVATERAAKEQEAAQRRQARSDPRLIAERKVSMELLRQKVALQEIALLRKAGASQIRSGDIVGGTATVRRAQDLEKSLRGSAKSANNIFFTFRRLVGTLAIFTLARRGVQVFNELVASGIRFNDTIEASTLGIGGLVATLGDVRNNLGQSVSAAEELDLALGLSRKQIELLRQDSLKTVATFSQLLDTFQVAVGPGLAAGLNLDEVRQLTVQISQAAAALSVPQNQLAEEIRSLLAGTIQARTTRIATALGITNADIRRLKETGELFDFLDDRLAGFAEAAQRQARQTIGGLQALLKGAFEALVGQAAKPLFDELIDLGNDLLDNVLTVEDAFGNLQPNPRAVSSFRELFEALREGVAAAREFVTELGFAGVQSIFAAIGFTLKAIVAALQVVGRLFSEIISLVTFFREQLGLGSREADSVASNLGKWAARIGLAFLLMKKLNVELLRSVRGPAVLVAAFAAVGKAIEFILEKIFGVGLSIRDTIQLVALGLFGTFIKVGEVVAQVGTSISALIGGALDNVISNAKQKALEGRRFIASLFGDGREAEALTTRLLEEELKQTNANAARRKELELELADIRAQAAAKQKAVEEEIAAIVGDAAARGAQGEGFDPGFDAAEAARKATEAASRAIVSTADKSINELSADLLKLSDQLRVARAEFAQGPAAGGLGGQLQGIFREEDIASGERLLQITQQIQQVKDQIARQVASEALSDERLLAINAALKTDVEDRAAALEALDLTEGEALLISLLRDQMDLRAGLSEAEKASFDLAVSKAAVLAQNELPRLREEVQLAQATVAAERALTSAIVANASQRSVAVIQARNAVRLAQEELAISQQQSQMELAAAQAAAQAAPPGAERDALESILQGLRNRASLEQEILGLRIQQLQKAQEEAELVANGTFAQGARAGFQQLADDLPTIFEVGLELTKTVVTGFARFAATEIVGAIVAAQQDGVDRSELFRQAAGQFAQELATQILQQVINNLLQILISNLLGRTATEITTATTVASIKVTAAATAAAIEIAAAQTAAAIRIASGGVGFNQGGLVSGFHTGGEVGEFFSRRAQGLAKGGKPSHIHPSDTIPAWLTPGEFVLRRQAVQAIGLANLQAMNGGKMRVVGSASAEAAGPAMGMASGGVVSGTTEQQSSRRDDEGRVVVVPAVVARDREVDQLVAGGRNAMLAFMREEADNIRTLLDRGAGRG